MDSSSKPPTHPTMVDLSQLVMGKAWVLASEITPQAWLEIIEGVLNLCRPYLEYLPAEPLSKVYRHVYLSPGGYDDLNVPPRVIKFAKGLSKTTHCLLISKFFFDKSHERYKESKSLLLTRKGELVIWHFKYREEVRHGLGYRAHHTGTHKIAQLSQFQYLKTDEFFLLLSKHPEIGQEVIRTLRSIAQDKKYRLEGALEGIRKLALKLDEIKSTIMND